MDDDWRGESLIRNVPRSYDGMGFNFAKRKGRKAKRTLPKLKKQQVRYCILPGCDNILSSRNKIGLCQTHKHNRQYCECGVCRSYREN